MNKSSPDIRRIVVVVPVHNEEGLLQQALNALGAARADVADIDSSVVVVLDACTDDSARIAAEWSDAASGRSVMSVDFRNVGRSRAAGFATAEAATVSSSPSDRGGDRLHETWYATTDADSVVRPDWLASHRRHARLGAQAVAGTVVLDLDASPDEVAAAYRSGYRHHVGHRHVHGANLALRADVYWAIGGFEPLLTGEDVGLIGRVENAGIPVLYACDSPVATSDRRDGRAPEGFAAHLRDLDAAVR